MDTMTTHFNGRGHPRMTTPATAMSNEMAEMKPIVARNSVPPAPTHSYTARNMPVTTPAVHFRCTAGASAPKLHWGVLRDDQAAVSVLVG